MVVDQPRAQTIQARLLEWWRSCERDFPWRREDALPFEVLVAEVLLVRKRAEEVAPVYRAVLDRYPDLEALGQADRDELADLLRSLGFQNRRADALVRIARQCREDGIPQGEADLLELPFVGRYAASATRCFAFDEPVAIVDSNVARVYGRLLGVEEDPQSDELWDLADDLLPRQAREFNLALLDLGATVCKFDAPRCERCPLNDVCKARMAAEV